MNETEEIRLIAAAKHGDPASFETLVQRYMGSAIHVAAGYVGNREDAVDMAQEAFYRVYKHLYRFREGERFAPWFFRILRNACLSFLEKRRRARRVSIHARDEDGTDMPLPDTTTLPDEEVERRERDHVLREALQELPEKHRDIIVLRHFRELTYEEIAAELDIPIGTVMSRLYHARKKLAGVVEGRLGGAR